MGAGIVETQEDKNQNEIIGGSMTPQASNVGNTKLLYVVIAVLISALTGTLGWGLTAVGNGLQQVQTMTIEFEGIKKDIEYIKKSIEDSTEAKKASDEQIGIVIGKLNALDKKVDVHIATHKQ